MITTVCLNPAIDRSISIAEFNYGGMNRVKSVRSDAGGKGVNISRALSSFGIKNTAVVAVGEGNGDSFLSSLDADGINCEAVWTKGLIRENITVHPKDAKETRLSFSGFSGDLNLIKKVEECVDSIAEGGDFVAVAGSLPAGIDIEAVKEFILRLNAKGVRTVIDSRSFTPADIIDCAPFLIKPNEQEIAAYTDMNIRTLEDAEKSAEEIRRKGVENVMISLGASGAVLSSGDGIYSVSAPKISVLSTIGAGDSSIAGFLAAYSDGKSYKECLKTAVAFGSAACMTEGTKPPKKEDIEAILKGLS
jgi:1-phosphofructokinase family hexose kinase